MKKDIQDGYFALVELFLPEFILNHFKLNEVRKEQDIFHLQLEEVNNVPENFSSEQIQSKGFFPTITIQDFPIRGHKVYMHIKRRRWLRVRTGEVIYRDWSVVAPGTRITNEFAAFLKEISRYYGH
ncbi:MAG: ISAon1 family transposase N-terminal region protein [Cytophaga sp.]|uniref:ISAon1 family transposase N-terminal region protein n=1 Tax=Cytophaga sp. TaxID=29535 RepID=UPI003F7E41B2